MIEIYLRGIYQFKKVSEGTCLRRVSEGDMFKGDEGDMSEVSVQMGHARGECLREDMSQESV